jgi:hypothetical protein
LHFRFGSFNNTDNLHIDCSSYYTVTLNFDFA